MSRFFKKVSKKVGLPPGSLVYVGEKKVEEVKIKIIDYDEMQFEEKETKIIEDCFSFKETPTVTWINIDGLHNLEIIEKIGKRFGLHPLILEDIVNTGQRPKLEDLDDHIFIVLQMLSYNEEVREIKSGQISLILGSNYVISFQEGEGDIFEPVRNRIRKSIGRIRKLGSDYLAYALVDAIVDHYFFILEKVGEHIESIEEELVKNPIPRTLQTLHVLKRELIFLRKSVWPLREIISGLERGESPLLKERTGIYYRDLYDHTIQVIDTTETFRDMVSGMLDTYLSSVSNKMNEVMKVLTIIATIFIPLTFIAGIYGMNFEYIPELKLHSGYFILWGIMIVVVIGMVCFFKRKKWL